MRRQRAGWGMQEKRFDLGRCVSVHSVLLVWLAQADGLGELGRHRMGWEKHRNDEWRRYSSYR